MAGVTGLVLACMLAACGGGSEGAIATDDTLVMQAGTSLLVPGEIETGRDFLVSMHWQLQSLDTPALDMQLQNQFCEVAVKEDRLSPAPANVVTEPVRISSDPEDVVPGMIASGSTWRCNVWLTSTGTGSTETRYQLLLTGVDTYGRKITHTRSLRVLP